MIAALPLLLAVAGGPPPAEFPIPHAVDCAHDTAADVRAADVRAVFADRSLIRADAEMATLYDAITNLVAMGWRGDLEDQQRDFLKSRLACGADRSCLVALYRKRIAALRLDLRTLERGGPY